MGRDIRLKVQVEDEKVKLNVQNDSEKLSLKAKGVTEVITSDYRKLNNKPTINGTELYDNYDEIDPTVPDWAKAEEPEEMSFADIKKVWDSVFSI